MIPPRTVLTAIDFSDTARSAFELAVRVARQARATLHVVHVEHPLLQAAATHSGMDLTGETRQELERFVASVSPAPESPPALHVTTGAVVEGILDTAREHQADLIVVGGRGMSGAEKLFFGSTTEGLLRRSHTSVLVVPTGWTLPTVTAAPALEGLGPVVAGVDPSDASVANVSAACALAELLHTSVEMLHVVPRLAVLDRWRDRAEAATEDRIVAARRELEDLVTALACAAPTRVLVESGDVAEVLAGAARPASGRTPIMVLGRKAPGTGGGAPGSIAYRVLLLAHVPVLMYTAPPDS